MAPAVVGGTHLGVRPSTDKFQWFHAIWDMNMMMSCDGVLNKTDPVWGNLPRLEAPNQFRQYRAQQPLFFTSLVLPSFNFLGVSCRNASCSSFCLISSVHPAHLHFSAGEEIEGSAPLLSTFACTDQRIPGCDPKQQCQSGSNQLAKVSRAARKIAHL